MVVAVTEKKQKRATAERGEQKEGGRLGFIAMAVGGAASALGELGKITYTTVGAGIASAIGTAANTLANIMTAREASSMNRKLDRIDSKLDSIESSIAEGNLAVVDAIERLRGDLVKEGSGSRRSGVRKSRRTRPRRRKK